MQQLEVVLLVLNQSASENIVCLIYNSFLADSFFLGQNISLNRTDCACFLSQHPCLSLHIIPTLCSSCVVFPAPGSGPDCLRTVTVMCHEQLTPDQVTLLTLIIPQVHFNYSSASSMFLFPSSTCIAPSPDPLPLFLFLQISLVQKNFQVVLLWTQTFTCTLKWFFQSFSLTDTHSFAAFEISSQLFCLCPKWTWLSNKPTATFIYISSHRFLHFSHLSPFHSLCRSGSRALPFSTWWESCFIYTLLFSFIFLFLYLHLLYQLCDTFL